MLYYRRSEDGHVDTQQRFEDWWHTEDLHTFVKCFIKRALNEVNLRPNSCFGELRDEVNIILYLFDHTIKPIPMYGNEISSTIDHEQINI